MSAREAKRIRILEGAVEVIARYGIRKTTMEDIAQKARLKPASVYYYFKNKEELLAAVVRHQAEEIHARIVDSIARAGSAEAKLVAFLLARFSYLDLVVKLREAESSVVLDTYPMIEEVVREYRDKACDLLLEVLELGKEQGEFDIDDPAKLAVGMIVVMRAMDTLLVSSPLDGETQEGLRAMLPVFLTGLKKR